MKPLRLNHVLVSIIMHLIGFAVAGCGTVPAATTLYTLTTATTGEGSIAPLTATKAEAGSLVTLAATPSAGWSFVSWAGANGAEVAGGHLLMNANKAVTAVFSKMPFALNVTITGNGSVKKKTFSTKAALYESGTSVERTPIPDAGWAFDHWTGDVTGGAAPAVLAMTSAKNVTAVFRQAKLLTFCNTDGYWGNLAVLISDLSTEVGALGIVHSELLSSSMATADLGSRGDVVWIAPAQKAAFYADYSASAARFEQFVARGGTLIMCVATLGLWFPQARQEDSASFSNRSSRMRMPYLLTP